MWSLPRLDLVKEVKDPEMAGDAINCLRLDRTGKKLVTSIACKHTHVHMCAHTHASTQDTHTMRMHMHIRCVVCTQSHTYMCIPRRRFWRVTTASGYWTRSGGPFFNASAASAALNSIFDVTSPRTVAFPLMAYGQHSPSLSPAPFFPHLPKKILTFCTFRSLPHVRK